MKQIPCRKCSKCGIYHNLAVEVCDGCGTDLKSIPAILINKLDIPVEQLGNFDDPMVVYEQKCPVCGTRNFTTDKDRPAEVCYNCYKSRIARVDPVEFAPEPEDEGQGENKSKRIDCAGDDHDVIAPAIRATKTISTNDDEDISNKADAWKRKFKFESNKSGYNNDDDDVNWTVKDGSGFSNPSTEMKSITLTALQYGRLSFTVQAEQGNYILGRSAHQSAFLEQDGWVGNEHCYLSYRNGSWYVKDNNSRNGTFVNAKDIGQNGEYILSDGDELKLGHRPDSMAFRITLNKC